MKVIELTRGLTTVVDDEDADLAAKPWFAVGKDSRWLASRCELFADGRRLRVGLGKVVLERKLGRPLSSTEAPSYADGNPLNNSRANLEAREVRREHRCETCNLVYVVAASSVCRGRFCSLGCLVKSRSASAPVDGGAQIPVSHGAAVTVDAADADLSSVRWSAHGTRGYAVNSKKGMMHRIILSRILNRPLERNEFVDHVDGDVKNNKRCNLRLATTAENSRNRGPAKETLSGYKGVCFNRQSRKWCAQICVNYTRMTLGNFDDIVLAALAYDKAARRLHGQFAKTNYPSFAHGEAT